MSKRKKITDPEFVFRIYCGEYRKLTPQVWISKTLVNRIDTFLDDIFNYRAVTPFEKAELSTFARTPSSLACSIYFIEYLKKLSGEMRRQRCFKVSPTRACELLYNLDADENWNPSIMRLQTDRELSELVSMPHYRDFKLRLWLESPREHIDWTLPD